MEPELTTNAAKIEKSALNRPKWLRDGSQDHFCLGVSPLFTNFWLPSGTPKSPKIQSLSPKGAPESDFLLNLLAKSVFLTFGLVFSLIFDETSMKNRCIFSKLHAIFSTWRWPKSMHRRSVLSTFRYFHLFENFENMTPKTKQNW